MFWNVTAVFSAMSDRRADSLLGLRGEGVDVERPLAVLKASSILHSAPACFNGEECTVPLHRGRRRQTTHTA